MAKYLNRYLTKENIKMASNNMKRCSTSFVISKLQIKTMKYCYTPVIMAKIQKCDNTK